MVSGQNIINLIAERQDLEQFKRKNWEGSFDAYLELVKQHPEVTRNAYERLYDMITSYGVEAYEKNREKKVRYRFFADPEDEGRDAVFGLDETLRALVNAFRSAAQG